MVRAEAAEVHYHYRDHDSDVVDESPPVQNIWYEVFHAQDVRLIYCMIKQNNEETAAKDIEIRWTIDGNVYFFSVSLPDNTRNSVYRIETASAGGTAGLFTDAAVRNAAYTVDKRGLDFKVEVRITSVPGTNQRLRCWCVRETEVQT